MEKIFWIKNPIKAEAIPSKNGLEIDLYMI